MSEAESQAARPSKTALVIEDSATQSLRLRVALEQAGLRVLLAENGLVGLQMARQEHPDVIVLDVQMPGLSGFQVCQRLKEEYSTASIPVILFTCLDDSQAVMRGLQLGAVDYIPKSAFAEAVLLETLRHMEIIEP